ncbi:MAG: hypothetical protein ABI047_10580 [Jatrophihabitantaceae bacterium]
MKGKPSEEQLRDMVAAELAKPKVSVITLADRTVPCEVHAGGLTEDGARIWHARPVDRDLRRSEAASIVHDPCTCTPETAGDAEVVLVRFACEHEEGTSAGAGS